MSNSVDNPFFARMWTVMSAHEPEAMKRLRRENLDGLTGRVLEIGIGTGLNMRHYDKSRIASLTGLDPALEMHKLAQKRIRGAVLDEPACDHNKKEKSGCAKPKPGATAGGCSFDGAQIALLPIADVAHIVHGPIACAGSSWDNRGTRSSGVTLYRIGMTTDLSETDVVMGRGEKRLFHAIKQAIDSYAPAAVFVYNTCVTALIGDDVEAVCRA